MYTVPESLLSRFYQLVPSPIPSWFLLCVLLLPLSLSFSLYKSNIRVPILGLPGPFSYFTALRFIFQAQSMLQHGYDKYRGTMFKVPLMDRWIVIVTGPLLIEELSRAPSDILSIEASLQQILQLKHTIGLPIRDIMVFLMPFIRQLTKNVPSLFPEVYQEVVEGFDEKVPATQGWMEVKALETMMQIVCRVSNRVFVGSPKCKEPDYVALNIGFAIDVMVGSLIINMFPEFLKPIVGRMLTRVRNRATVALKHLEPLITERRGLLSNADTWNLLPNDMLSWLVEAEKGHADSQLLTIRMLCLNFAAIHTTSMSITNALLDLATHEHYADPLRQEVQDVIEEEGWTHLAMDKMPKLDSFLRESQRVNGLGALSMTRTALKPYTFKDGTTLPKGTMISATGKPTHLDPLTYSNAYHFDGFRFYRDGGDHEALSLVTTSADYLSFGHGRHACAGRFFAAYELKAIMAHVLHTYDVKLAKNGKRFPDRWLGTVCAPDPRGTLLFRRRDQGTVVP